MWPLLAMTSLSEVSLHRPKEFDNKALALLINELLADLQC